jgi:hypothetical protein
VLGLAAGIRHALAPRWGSAHRVGQLSAFNVPDTLDEPLSDREFKPGKAIRSLTMGPPSCWSLVS